MIVFFVTLSDGLWSLDPQKKITQYTLNAWETERGLPNNQILAISQDRSGYLWLGTAEGLVRFDGVHFSIFNGKNTSEILDDVVNNLYVDHLGTLWIGTLSGKILSLEQGEFKRHLLDRTIASMAFMCMIEDGLGNLWIGTSGGLFCRPSPGNGLFQKYHSFPGPKIFCLAKDLSGRLLVGTMNRGVYSLENEKWRVILSPTVESGGTIYVLEQGRDGVLWLGTENGLYSYRNNMLLKCSLKQGSITNITALVEDRDNNLWIGSEYGLFRRQNSDFQFLGKDQGLGGNLVYSLHADVEGSLWVGTVDGGLVQVRDEKITTIAKHEGLMGEKFRCLLEDDSGALWIGGLGGYLNRYQNGRVDDFRLPARFESVDINSLEKDVDGSLWLGTDSGLVVFRDGRFREIPLPGPNPNIGTRCILQDRAGCLWIGTWGAGLLYRRGKESAFFSIARGLHHDRVSSLFEDRQGNLWVGYENGLAVMKAGMPDKFLIEPFLNNCHTFSFYQDGRGTLWVGTRQGLKVYSDGRWGALDIERGLFDNRIYAILEDGLGYLWMSSERGIFRARKDELEKAAFDKDLKVSGLMFDENDGMKSRICNYGSPSGWKDGDGRLWFANLAGVVSIDPVRIRKNNRVPPVLLEEIVVDNRLLTRSDMTLANALSLPAGSQKFEFHYTALSFIRSDKIEFKYKLEGYDKEWTSAGNRRQAFYTNLKPGHYRFRVIAANADGVWNTAGAAFVFYLRPFVYQTWWFRILAVLVFAVLSAVVWQLLKKYLRAITFFRMKTEIGHFKILETIGTGGMATVYKAQDLLNKNRLVALKVLKEENYLDETQRKRFKYESLIIEQLDHPHIVRIIERGEMDDCWYIAMELLPGESLAQLVKRQGRLPVGDALEIMQQIVDALKAIHAQGIVHRDLKPENIMVSQCGGQRHFIKLLDFGLAITPAQSRLTMSGVVMGTIRYLPPERLRGGASTPAGDVYSVGVIFYEMVTGSKPFWSEATGEVLNCILKTYPLQPREISSEIPIELNSLIMAMLDKYPGLRPDLESLRMKLQLLAEKYPPLP